MALDKIKVSELQQVGDINNFQVFGWDTAAGSARASMSQLRGNTGATPNITIKVNSIPHGSTPSVGKTGTAENPVFTIGFPLAKNGEKPLLRKDSSYLQYKYESDSVWSNLISLDELRFKYSDLTTEQIQELQSPAIEAAGKVDEVILKSEEATEAAIEATGATTEAINNATTATNAATLAATNATNAADRVDTAINNSTNATNAATLAATNASEAANRANTLSDNRDEIRDGYWWRWNESTGEYENTGIIAHGNVMYATFYIDENTKKLYMKTPTGYDSVGFKLVENKLYVIVS